jgi:hypothetical protein
MLTTIVTTVIGALCIATIFAALKSRWLYVIAPRLHLNTPLSDGQIASLTITNVGLLAEEDVALTIRASASTIRCRRAFPSCGQKVLHP